jgi:LPS export ABC transporter protein LptC
MTRLPSSRAASRPSSRAKRGIRTFVFATLVTLVAGTACRESGTPPVVSGPTAADSADQMLIGVTYVMTTKGIERGELNADTAYVLDEQTRFDLRRAHINFKTETGAPQGTMEANRGVYNQRTQILEGWGDVVLKLTDGRTLKSPHVTFNQITHKVSSDTTYTLLRPNGDTQRGKGFLSNQAFTTFECKGNCTGDMTLLLPATAR